MYKELFPVVVAACQWSSRRVEFWYDNEMVVAVLSFGTSRDSSFNGSDAFRSIVSSAPLLSL